MDRTHATPKGILTIAKTVPGQYALLLFLDGFPYVELTARKSVRALCIRIEMTLEFRDLASKPVNQIGRGDAKTGNLE